MWWYYKCVNLIKVLIQGSKVILFSIENALQENHGHGWSSAPYGQSDSISRRWAASKPDSWKDNARAARFLFSSSGALTLLNMAWTSLKLRFPFSRLRPTNARKADLEAGPPDSLSTKPTIGGGLRPCQSRNGATKSTIAEESFPDDVTQPSQVSTREQPKEPSWTRDTRNKELNSRGKTNQLRACFKTHPSKYKLNS